MAKTFQQRLKERAGVRQYILTADGDPEPCDDLLRWGQWMQTAHRVVAQDKDEGPDGTEIVVSTVFLGLDHNDMLTGPPVLWETMVFGGAHTGACDRYTSREAALAGHQAWCQTVKASLRR